MLVMRCSRFPFSATVGDDFFQDKPEYPVQKLFLQMKNLRKKYARAKELVVAKGYLGFADKVKEVEGLGFLEATRRECCLHRFSRS
jgi:hypothetical protein